MSCQHSTCVQKEYTPPPPPVFLIPRDAYSRHSTTNQVKTCTGFYIQSKILLQLLNNIKQLLQSTQVSYKLHPNFILKIYFPTAYFLIYVFLYNLQSNKQNQMVTNRSRNEDIPTLISTFYTSVMRFQYTHTQLQRNSHLIAYDIVFSRMY